jgi:phosphatidylserine/phosphatidylglycerophosphate/cardiolipin synthase-like enzyme
VLHPYIPAANFNDRSMLGDRDSELGLVIKDMARVDGVMDGQPTEVGRFPHEFRLRLWQVLSVRYVLSANAAVDFVILTENAAVGFV